MKNVANVAKNHFARETTNCLEKKTAGYKHPVAARRRRGKPSVGVFLVSFYELIFSLFLSRESVCSARRGSTESPRR